MDTADYVIVGAGSAGCVLADRLTAAGASVILLEAGPSDRSPLIHIPAGTIRLRGHPVYDWNFNSEPQPLAGSRSIAIPRGRVLGGTSSINGMNFVRGHAADFDAWAQAGCRGWSFADVLPHFKAIERYEGDASEYRGKSGPIAIEHYRTILPITHLFVEAARQAGFAYKPDLNSGTMEGVAHSQMSRRGRFRQSTAATFLAAAKRRPSLRIETNALATRLMFEGKRCIGVAYRQGHQTREARARRDVIVSAGTVKSPQLLQVSGVGPAAHLRSLGIGVVHDLAGVGANLSDHYAAAVAARVAGVTTNNQLRRWPRLGFELMRWAFNGRGAFSSGVSSATAYGRSRDGLASPDIQLLFFPGSFDPRDPNELEREPGIRLSVSLARPRSRGTIMAKSADPSAAPAIHLNYLSDPDDLRVLIAGMRTARRIFAAPALAAIIRHEIAPGPAAQTDEALAEHIRATGQTVHHLVGTCRMGEDANAVVDPRLRVHGVTGLRVIDASIMPQVTTGNTNAPTIMIGEKGAAMIVEEMKL